MYLVNIQVQIHHQKITSQGSSSDQYVAVVSDSLIASKALTKPLLEVKKKKKIKYIILFRNKQLSQETIKITLKIFNKAILKGNSSSHVNGMNN